VRAAVRHRHWQCGDARGDGDGRVPVPVANLIRLVVDRESGNAVV